MSGLVKGYVDGAKQFEFSDATADAVISNKNTLRLFKDITSGGTTGEDSAGSVARIRLYDSALSEADVGKLDRLEPTTFTVNSTEDASDSNLLDGKCSTSAPQQCTLRAAIQQANATSGNDTINFASNLSRNFITLTRGELAIDDEPGTGDDLTVNGPKLRSGAGVLAVTAQNSSRVFRILDDATVAINRLRISDGGTAILRNTIVVANTASTGPDVSGSYLSQGNNLVENTSGASITHISGGTDVLGKDPHLGPLQDNGGPTGTHALLSLSPAIDHGSKTGCPSTDQRGVIRPRDGDGNGGARCDIGSYEKT